MKRRLDINVYEAALGRIRYLYDHFDHSEVWLSLSGGKDSTVCYHLMREVCDERGIDPINILMIDLEGHYRLHVDFMDTLVKDKRVKGYWLCLPFNLSNASSFHEPKWLCWDQSQRDKWIREMPTNRLVVSMDTHPFGDHFRLGMEFEEFIVEFPRYLIEQGASKVGQVIGIRADESYNRYLKMAVRENREFYEGHQWILKQKVTKQETYSVHPIYDWTTADVWRYLKDKPYTSVYDKMYLAGYPLGNMRICQPYGEEQRDNIDLFAKIEPETWSRMTERVLGGNFAKLYRGKNVIKGKVSPPDGVTWQSWARLILATMPPYLRDHYIRRINVFLRWWRKELYGDIAHVYTKELADNEKLDGEGVYIVEIPDEDPRDKKKECPSWRRIAKVLVKGDYLCKNLTFQQNQHEYEKLESLKSKHQLQ